MAKLRAGNKQLIKAINRARIIKLIREEGPLSRTDIAHKTDLVLSTITNLCNELVDKKILFEIGEGRSTGGRRPINLLFNNSYGHVICVKIEIDKVIVSLSNLRPTLLKTIERKFPVKSPFEVVRTVLGNALDDLTQLHTDPGSMLMGAGVAVSGIIDRKNGVILSSTLLGWKNVEIGKFIENRLKVEAHIDNDVNCFTLAQCSLGRHGNKSSIFCMTIGEGIGAGVIIHDKLYRGAFGGAGEIGHTVIEPNGKPCYCGQCGCLENYASDKAVINFVKEKTGSLLSIKEIDKKARSGDTICLDAFVQAGMYIGLGLLNIIMHYNPEVIVIGGKGTEEREFILPKMKETLDRNWFNKSGICNTPLVFDELGNQAFLLGAAILVLDDLFDHPIYENRKTILDTMDY